MKPVLMSRCVGVMVSRDSNLVTLGKKEIFHDHSS